MTKEVEQESGSDSDGGGQTPNDTVLTKGQLTARNYIDTIVDLWSDQQGVLGEQIAHSRAHATVERIMQTLGP